MRISGKRIQEIRATILESIPDHSEDISRHAADVLGITRQSVAKHLRSLIQEGLVSVTGITRDRRYHLISLLDEERLIPVTSDLEEHIIWRDLVAPSLADLKPNVLKLFEYGVSEMINNVRDHSGSPAVSVWIRRDAARAEVRIMDFGVGIFDKIQHDLHLDDPRHALLELSKGKLTTDSSKHTGEGIFFTSRMFDNFNLLSGGLFYSKTLVANDDDDWLIEIEEHANLPGTMVSMTANIRSERTTKDVFDRYSTPEFEYSFSRTHVPVKLARYDQEQLISRSQARRVLARFDKFKEVMLDFQGVDSIGQAFADEIFRVFQLEHPEIRVLWVNATNEVEKMILRAIYRD